MQHLPGAHFLAPKVEKVQEVNFFRKSALFSPQIIELTWENIRAGAPGPLGGGKVHFFGKSAESAFLSKKSFKTIGNFPSRNHLSKSEDFLNFSKNEKVTKSHFRVFAYVCEVFCCSGRSKSQSCVLSTSEHLGAPKSPKSIFFTRHPLSAIFPLSSTAFCTYPMDSHDTLRTLPKSPRRLRILSKAGSSQKSHFPCAALRGA